MKTYKILPTTLLFSTLTWSNLVNAESIPEFAFDSIPPEAMQAIDTINQSLQNRSIPLFDGRALSAGIGAITGVLVYNLLPSTAIMTVAGTTVVNNVAANQLPIVTSAVIGVLIADYLYRQSNNITVFEF